MDIQLNKEYKTRSGLISRIYAIDGSSERPVHGAIFMDNRWVSRTWSANGLYMRNLTLHDYDLIESENYKLIKKVSEMYPPGTRFYHMYSHLSEPEVLEVKGNYKVDEDSLSVYCDIKDRTSIGASAQWLYRDGKWAVKVENDVNEATSNVHFTDSKLEELNKKVDELLGKETRETLAEWIEQKRKNI